MCLHFPDVETDPLPTCKPEEVLVNNVVFKWSETVSSFNATFVCPNNEMFAVSRQCYFDGQWGTFNEKGCGVLAMEFEDISVASQNVMMQLWQSFSP